MSSHYHYMSYALKNNELVEITTVPNGLACGCTCPACGAELVAHKGEQRIHHFKHRNAAECEYAYETSLHLLAKQILTEAKSFMIPDVYITYPLACRRRELISKHRQITLSDVFIEKHLGDIKPDIVVTSHGKSLLIEIFVTHRIDCKKTEKVEKRGVSLIEIDLSKREKLITYDELKEILLNGVDVKNWVFNAMDKKYQEKILSHCERMPLIKHEHGYSVQNCPINYRYYMGMPYANASDCAGCSWGFYIPLNGNEIVDYRKDAYVMCSYKSRIKSINDLKLTQEERVKRYNAFEIRKALEKKARNGLCPICGGKLIIVNGKNGEFNGCSHFPHCEFTMSINDVHPI